jgi:conjugative transposon TraN protein
MKSILIILFVSVFLNGYTQIYTAAIRIEVSFNKTTSLIFPSTIVSIDRGSNEIMVQKSAENILKIKATADSLKETNLTIVTADGKLYSFLVNYDANPQHLSIHLGNNLTVKTENKLSGVCATVLKLKSNLAGLQFASGKMSLKMLGWYVRGAQLFCKLKIENRSQIGYDIDQLHFYIRDNYTSKRTASQEIIQRPVYLEGDTGTIRGRSARVWVVALEKFTIPDDKHFAVEILEKNGGRHLYLKTFNRQVILAKEF